MQVARSGSYITAAYVEVKKIDDNQYEYVPSEGESFWKLATGTIEEIITWAQDYVYTSLTGPSGTKIWIHIKENYES